MNSHEHQFFTTGHVVTIRRMRAEDVNAVNGLFVHAYEYYPYAIDQSAVGQIYFVAEIDGRIVGVSRSTPCIDDGSFYESGGLVVHSQYRRMGIGSALVDAGNAESEKCGAREIVSEPVTNDERHASQQYYGKSGFRYWGMQPVRYPGVSTKRLQMQPLTVLICSRAVNGTIYGERKVFIPDHIKEGLSVFLPEGVLDGDQDISSTHSAPGSTILKRQRWKAILGSQFIDIPVNWPRALQSIAVHEIDGFRACAFLPGFGRTPDGQPCDLLRMFKPGIPAIDWDLVHMHLDLQPIKQFVVEQCASVHAN